MTVLALSSTLWLFLTSAFVRIMAKSWTLGELASWPRAIYTLIASLFTVGFVSKALVILLILALGDDAIAFKRIDYGPAVLVLLILAPYLFVTGYWVRYVRWARSVMRPKNP